MLSPESRWYFQLFGGFEARWGSLRINRFRTAKTASLLGYLVAHPPHRFAREALAELFWGDMESERARNNLSVALHALRHALEIPGAPQIVEADSKWIGLKPDSYLADVLEFEQAIQLARASSDPAQQYERLAFAAHLYQGDFLPGIYDAWVVEKASELQAECLNALEQLARFDAERGNIEAERGWLTQAVGINPLDSDLSARLIELHLQARQYESAAQLSGAWLEQYQRLSGEPPPPRIVTLYQEAQRGRTSRPRRSLSLSETRPDKPALSPQFNSDASAPNLPYLTPLPPLSARREGGAPAAHAHISPSPFTERGLGDEVEMGLLPALPRTRFVGRDGETAHLMELLTDAAVPCVVIVGLGGMGKTRLALEVAHRIAASQQMRVHWISLTAISRPEQIIPVVKQALGLAMTSNPTDALRRYSAQHRPLIFLDNFEHLLPEGALIVAELLRAVPEMRLCITSRFPLRIESEMLFPLAPLPCPDAPDCPALALFVDRVRQVSYDFRLTEQNRPLILELCRQLGSIPLALELAAARLNTLSPKQLLERVHDRLHWLKTRRDDIEARHRAMLSVLEATAAVLPLETRRIFAQLSLLPDVWDAELAQATVGMPPERFAEALEPLLEASLIERVSEEPARYRMLEIVREYAQSLLSDARRRAAENRLCAWMLRTALHRAEEAYTPRLTEWLLFWDSCRTPLLLTLDLLERDGRLHEAICLLRAVERYLYLRPLHDDALNHLQRWLNTGKLSSRDETDARLLQARLLFEASEGRQAMPIVMELAQLERRNKRRGWALYWIVQIAFTLRDMPTALRYWKQLRRLYPCPEQPQLHCAIHYLWGYLEPVKDIVAWREEGVHFAQQSGDPILLGSALVALIELLVFYGEYDRALRYTNEAYRLYTQMDEPLYLIGVLHSQIYCLLQQGELAQAQQTLNASSEMESRLGLPKHTTHWFQASLWRWEGQLAQAQQFALSQVAELEMQQLWHQGAMMWELAALCAAEMGNLEEALRYAAEAVRLREREDDLPRKQFTRTHYAYLRARAGNPDALKELEECLLFWRTLHWRPWQATTLLYLAETYAQYGETAHARVALEEAIQLNQSMGRALALKKCQILKNLLPI
jgi:predicted ATPase/DNA-binding SARP family transcriptional activator/predicted Zn-dependent protease